MYISILSLLGLGVGASLVFLLALILILLFEVYMFIQVILDNNLTSERKLLWLVGMLLVHPFVAIAYYFTDFQKKS